MEYTPHDKSEDDSSEKDADKTKKKKTTKVARNMPLGITVDAEKSADDKPRAPLSINERLMKQLADRTAEKQKESAQPSEETKPEESEATAEATETPATSEILEATEWDSEGELRGDGEIPLGSTQSEAPAEVPHETPEETFTEIPIVEPDTSGELDIPIEAVSDDLLETGLGTESVEPEPVATSTPARRLPVGFVDPSVRAESSAWYDAAAEDRARAEELNNAEYYAEKRGVRRGLGTGLFFGWLFGRHGKKKAAEEHAKELKAQNKQIEELKQNQVAAEARLGAIQRNQEQMRSVTQKEGVEPAKKPENSPKSDPEQQNTVEKIEKLPKAVAYEAAERHMKDRKEEIAEKLSAASPERPKATSQEKAKEVAIEDMEITEDTYEAPEGRRVETSAWHRIEIDEKTGKAVSDPEVAYGEEFKREQKQEVKKETPDGDSPGGSSAVNVFSGVAAALATRKQQKAEDGLHSQAAQATPAASPVQDAHQHLTAGNDLLRYASNPLVWITAIVIVGALFFFGVLR